MAPKPLTPVQKKAKAGLAAWQKIQKDEPDLAKEIGANWSASKLTWDVKTQASVAKVKDPATKKALIVWMSDPAAVKIFTDGVAAGVAEWTKGAGDALKPGIDAVGKLIETGPGAIVAGLSSTYNTILSQVFRMGVSAVVILVAVVFLVLGVVILLKAPLVRAAAQAKAVVK